MMQAYIVSTTAQRLKRLRKIWNLIFHLVLQ
jgi:hypothetical protein